MKEEDKRILEDLTKAISDLSWSVAALTQLVRSEVQKNNKGSKG